MKEAPADSVDIVLNVQQTLENMKWVINGGQVLMQVTLSGHNMNVICFTA